ncbi:hypothetical protein [Variovorax sp. UC74_104]|uniref:hypothetical protein n=1 Tax=Variovorax sp. UC74_104 TaxID=3374555 RepID=UPI0037568865
MRLGQKLLSPFEVSHHLFKALAGDVSQRRHPCQSLRRIAPSFGDLLCPFHRKLNPSSAAIQAASSSQELNISLAPLLTFLG